MSVPTVTTTISYRGAGIQAPVFVAGSFTEPSWHPLEMRKGEDIDGEANFSATVQVMANTVYQYKFKIGRGEGERWVLDPNCPTGMLNIVRAVIMQHLRPLTHVCRHG